MLVFDIFWLTSLCLPFLVEQLGLDSFFSCINLKTVFFKVYLFLSNIKLFDDLKRVTKMVMGPVSGLLSWTVDVEIN